MTDPPRTPSGPNYLPCSKPRSSAVSAPLQRPLPPPLALCICSLCCLRCAGRQQPAARNALLRTSAAGGVMGAAPAAACRGPDPGAHCREARRVHEQRQGACRGPFRSSQPAPSGRVSPLMRCAPVRRASARWLHFALVSVWRGQIWAAVRPVWGGARSSGCLSGGLLQSAPEAAPAAWRRKQNAGATKSATGRRAAAAGC